MTDTDQQSVLFGIGMLGMPYDIMGAYANASALNIANPVLDFGGANYNPDADPSPGVATVYGRDYDYPSDVFSVAVLQEARAVDVDYTDAESRTLKLNVGVSAKGSYALFTGSFQTDLDYSYASSSYFQSLSRRNRVHSYALTVRNPSENLGAYLTPQADQDINGPGELDPPALLEKYATHVLVGGVFGGILQYTQSFSRFEYQDERSATAQLDVNYGAYEGQARMGVSTDEVGSTTESNGTFEAWGGTSQALKQGYGAWAQSIDEGNFVLMDFPQEGQPLIPISDLARDSDRQKAILDAINAKLEAAGPPIPDQYALEWDESKKRTLSVRDGSIETYISVKSTSEVIVGYGAHIADSHATRSTIRVLDLSTGTTKPPYVTGNVDTYEPGSWDSEVNIPAMTDTLGVAVVGVGMRADDSTLTTIKLDYRELDPSQASAGFLSTVVDSATNDTKHDLESYLSPDLLHPGEVIVSIGFGTSSNGNNVHIISVEAAPLIRVKV